jgi:hypothetical protein
VSLIGSSVPGAVERDAAIRLLAERVVSVRAVCAELRWAGAEGPGALATEGVPPRSSWARFVTRRTRAALYRLLEWVGRRFPSHIESRAADGLDQMAVPAGCEQAFEEIRDGTRVCEALWMLLTADTEAQAVGDAARLAGYLDHYWSRWEAPASLPLS